MLSFRRDPAFVRFLAGTFAFFVLQTQMYHVMAIYAAKDLGLHRSQVGALFVVNGILVVLVQLPVVRIIARIGTARALVLGSLGYLAAYTACGFAVGFLTLLGCVAVATLCEIVAAPAHQARVTALAPPDRVAGYAGVAGLAQGLAQTFGPALGGALLSLGSSRLGWAALGAVGLLAAAAFARRRGA
jgi:MFS family permease